MLCDDAGGEGRDGAADGLEGGHFLSCSWFLVFLSVGGVVAEVEVEVEVEVASSKVGR